MANRKPPGVGWESWVEQQIREAQERGEFDNVAGKGKPIPGAGEAPDELWWVKQKLKREGVSFLPPTLAIRKELDDARDRIARTATEAAVRQIVADINARIRTVNRMPTSGPPSNLMPLDVERVVEDWRARRAAEPS